MAEYRDAKWRIKEAYSGNVLKPLVGDAELCKKLEKGLETTLTSIEQELKGEIIVDQSTVKDRIRVYDDPIDFPAIEKIAAIHHPEWVNTAKRMKSRFKEWKIDTYGDLFEHGYLTPHADHGVRVLRWRGIGRQVCQLLYTHLDDLGIQFFDTPFTEEEILKKERL